MRLGVHVPTIAPRSRMEDAVAGLDARGHALLAVGRPAPGSHLTGLEKPDAAAAGGAIDVLLAGPRALPAAWWAARLRAQAVVLALDARTRAAWGLLDRWAWDVTGGFGVIDEADTAHFLAHAPEAERERLALWPATGERAAPDPSTLAETDVLERACERALARRSAGPGRAALFVDRDGTLVEERHHLSDPNDLSLLPRVAESLRAVRAAGHPVVLISNQAGVGRGLFPEERVHAVMARLRRMLRAEGVELDAVRFCPHAPDAGCDCRKPGGRLLREAADDLRLSLRDSVMVGDKWIDVDAGRGVGATGVLVRTGHGAEEAGLAAERGGTDPVFADLPAAARWFLERADA